MTVAKKASARDLVSANRADQVFRSLGPAEDQSLDDARAW
jgi:hypothetical protein